jgi:hypothetical protein
VKETASCCQHRAPPPPPGSWSVVPLVVVMALIPKCPMCLLAYGAVFGAAGTARFVVGPLVAVLAVLSLVANSFVSIRRSSLLLFATGTFAISLIYGLDRWAGFPWAKWVGLAVMASGHVYEGLHNSLGKARYV